MDDQSAWVLDIDGRTYDLRRRADRRRFIEIETTISVSTQIRLLRLMRGWSQAELARRAGMRQERISALEHAIVQHCRIATLRRLASVFDVALLVRFEPWSAVIGRGYGVEVPPEYSRDEALLDTQKAPASP